LAPCAFAITLIGFVLASDRDLKTHEQALHTVNT